VRDQSRPSVSTGVTRSQCLLDQSNHTILIEAAVLNVRILPASHLKLPISFFCRNIDTGSLKAC